MALSTVFRGVVLAAILAVAAARDPFGATAPDAAGAPAPDAPAPDAPAPDAPAPVAPAPDAPAPDAPPPEAPVKRTFEIANDQFLLNGEPVQIISTSLHYFRIRPEQWEDRLLRAKSLGVNAISTYVPWNFHEPRQGELRFSGEADLDAFLALAQSLDLLVLLRVGPYVCAEWDLGGLPSWLLAQDPEVELRSDDPAFLALVDAWWAVLLPCVAVQLWANGGPVVLVQVENEYGYLASEGLKGGKKANSTAYLTHLVNTTRTFLGEDVILYTTDLADPLVLGNGTLNGSAVYTVVDAPLAADYDAAFALQKLYNPPGQSPPFVSEFYTGWFTNWGQLVARANASLAVAQLEHILALNASVNFYMGVGGTSYGSYSGANTGADKHQFYPQITSYDYSAPIGEGGDLNNPLYDSLRAVVSAHLNASLPSAPKLPPRKALPAVDLNEAAPLLDSAVLDAISLPVAAIWPKNMEYFNQTSGLILYTATLPPNAKPTDDITIFGVKDRAQVYVTTPAVPATPIVPSGSATGPVRRFLGLLQRWVPSLKLPLAPAAPKPLDQVQILVEDLGRANFGPYIKDETKGVGAVMLGFIPIFHWTVNPIPLTEASIAAVPFKAATDLPAGAFEPTFFRGTFNVTKPVDTFLSLKGWTKGYAFVNGFNLGRYWPVVGPQCHLYIPAPLLTKGANSLVLLELDAAPASPSVSFTNSTDFSCVPTPLTPPALTMAVQGRSASRAAAI